MSAVLVSLVGLAVLFLGRKLFWIFVAAVGFVAGMLLVPHLLPDSPQWLVLALAIVVGCVGAALAVVLQRVAVGIAGFVAGGYLAMWLLTFFSVNLGDWNALSWVIFIVGGIIGSLLLSVVFDVALIVLSSAAGAGLIADTVMTSFTVEKVIGALLFLALLAVGVVVQSRMLRREQ